jgi:hypothetical protein
MGMVCASRASMRERSWAWVEGEGKSMGIVVVGVAHVCDSGHGQVRGRRHRVRGEGMDIMDAGASMRCRLSAKMRSDWQSCT